MATPGLSGRNRRRFPRLETVGLIDGHLLPVESPLTIRDLSLGGFSTESSVPFTPGTSYAFRFTSAMGVVANLGATAVHCRLTHVSGEGRHQYQTGFEFVETAGQRASIESLVELLSTALARA